MENFRAFYDNVYYTYTLGNVLLEQEEIERLKTMFAYNIIINKRKVHENSKDIFYCRLSFFCMKNEYDFINHFNNQIAKSTHRTKVLLQWSWV